MDDLAGVVQVTPSGTLDSSFGVGGVAMLSTTGTTLASVTDLNAMTITSAGRLIVAGDGQSTGTASPSSNSFYAARLNANGSLDTSFGTNGIARVPDFTINGVTSNGVQAIAVQPGGRIILASVVANSSVGSPLAQPITDDVVVVGLTANGTLDTSFGGPSAVGEVILTPDPTNPSASGNRDVSGLAIEADGQILVAGAAAVPATLVAPGTGILTRLNADGTTDTTFGQGGTVTFADGLVPSGVAVEPNGQILVPGYVSTPSFDSQTTTLALARLDAGGVLDPFFGQASTPGLATYPIVQLQAALSNALIDSQDLLVLTGSFETYLGSPAGTYETEDLVAIGVSASATPTPVLTQPPADYDGPGKTNVSAYLLDSGAFAYRPTGGGPDVVVPFGTPGVGQTIPAPGDYTGAGYTEIAAYLTASGTYAIRPADGGPDELIPFGIAGLGQSIPTPGDFEGSGKDDIAVYRALSAGMQFLIFLLVMR